jgi:uncharacterized protein with PIN domain
MAHAEFRFYAELNDFLKASHRRRAFRVALDGHPRVGDIITALGVPHPEVDLILVNGRSAGFDRRLRPGDRVAVYPMFEAFDITPLVRLRPRPLRRTAFILDVHLGQLARRLRLLGFDSTYRNDYDEAEIILQARKERRVILTRGCRLLKAPAVRHGYRVRAADPDRQVPEILARFDLASQIRAFSRCTVCNGRLAAVPKAAVMRRLPPRTRRYYDTFWVCRECARIYWQGSHYARLAARIRRWRAAADLQAG